MGAATIQINEHSKAGNTILELLEIFSQDKKGVKIIEEEKKSAKEAPISKNVPNAKTLKTMKETEKGIGVKKFESVEDLLSELNSYSYSGSAEYQRPLTRK